VLLELGDDQEQVTALLASHVGGDVPYEDFIKWLMRSPSAGSLHADPLEQVAGVFRSFDVKNSGRIPLRAMSRVLKELSSSTIAESDAENLFGAGCTILEDVAQRELDGQDMVNYEEFLAWLFEQAQMASPTRKRAAAPGSRSYFAGARTEVPKVNRKIGDDSEPEAKWETLQGFREQHAGNRDLLEQLRNKVLVCKNCAKPCAYTMLSCNGCGASLEEIPLSYNDNVFMGFIYGVGRGKFPYKISVRRESPSYLAFDDPLSMSPLHLCIIPTSVYVADWRYLFTNPAKGRQIVDELADFGAKAAVEQYWSDDAFRSHYFGDSPLPETTEEVLESVAAGFNFPPSMYQLHLQFIHYPLFPFHACKALQGIHFTRNRFFIIEYIRAALAACCEKDVCFEIHEHTDIDEVIRKIAALGIDYDAFHTRFLKRNDILATQYNCWQETDFKYTVKDGTVIDNQTCQPLLGQDAKALQAADDKFLRSYGRPYINGDCNQPTLSLYRYAKAPHEVKDFSLLPKTPRPV